MFEFKLLIVLFSGFYSMQCIAQPNKKLRNDTVRKTDDYSIIDKSNPNPTGGFDIVWKETGEILYHGKKDASGSNGIVMYNDITTLADELFITKKYSKASALYQSAFALNNDKGKVKHRYNAACSYSILGDTTKAFVELFKLSTIGKYYNYFEISTDDRLKPLHSNAKWNALLLIVKENAEKVKEKLNAELGNG